MITNLSSTGEDVSSSPVIVPVREGVWAIPEDQRPFRVVNKDGREVGPSVASSQTTTALGQDPSSKNGKPNPALMFLGGIVRRGLDRVLGPVALPKETSTDADAGDFSCISSWQKWRLGMKD